MRFSVISATAAVAAVIGCSGSDELEPYALVVQPGEVQFGNVEVNMTSKAVITLASDTGKAFELESVTMRPLDQLTFGFDTDTMSAPDGGQILLEVEYHPVGPGASSIELVIVPKGAEPKIVLVSGTGIEPAELRVGKLMFDFGTVLVGSSDMMTTTLENRNATPGTVTFDPGLNVDHCDAPNADLNNFCVVFLGKTLDSNRRFPLEPNESSTLMVRFIPQDSGVAERADFTLSTCAEDACEVTVELAGTGG